MPFRFETAKDWARRAIAGEKLPPAERPAPKSGNEFDYEAVVARARQAEQGREPKAEPEGEQLH